MNDETRSKIDRLERFVRLIREVSSRRFGVNDSERDELRSRINREAVWVRRQVIENKCFQTVTAAPAPAVGGMVMTNLDVFNTIFEPPHGRSTNGFLIDMIDKTIAKILDPDPEPIVNTSDLGSATLLMKDVREGYAFVAMAIDDSNGGYVDTLDAIKEAAQRCGVLAERIDEDQSNERITDRILQSIDVAEHVIADLTSERPNVFYEAGYAQGIGKIPIYIARSGTKLHFDLKDYPVIFFETYKQLKDDLEKRLRAVSKVKAAMS